MIQFGPETCHDLGAGLELEWLETNGIGGFASATLAGVNTRRYHGLLTAALTPPLGRCLLLSKLEETLIVNGTECEFSANLYPGAVHPQGFRYLEHFRLDPCPIFTYNTGAVQLEKRIFMVQGENTTVVEYQNLCDSPCLLSIRPLIAFRGYHATTHANPALNPIVELQDGDASIRPYESLPRLHLFHNATRVTTSGEWYRNFEYPRERERGLDWTEDLFQPMLLEFEMPARGRAQIVATTETRRPALEPPRPHPPSADTLLDTLTTAAAQFLTGRTVIAGYHWFSNWGRDTLIALPGLTLATGRFDTARQILVSLSAAEDMGMIPNTLPDSGETSQYNTVDASLWYFEAIRQFLEFTGDFQFVAERLYPTMKIVIDRHLRGTRYGIHCGTDGLIAAGTPDTQLTWMDARVNGIPVTSRHGKPVEIQALWYNALLTTEAIAQRVQDTELAAQLGDLASKAETSFNTQFWNPELGCLYDVVDDNGRPDAALRPNQVIALSLGHTMVPADRARSVLTIVRRELLAPVGLRTLSTSDRAYRARCEGDSASRDGSYHQGTIWPWLLGPYLRSCARFNIESGVSLEPLRDHLNTAGLGTISEIFDGDPPHTPRGCIAQAWSVAEILFCYTRGVFARIS